MQEEGERKEGGKSIYEKGNLKEKDDSQAITIELRQKYKVDDRKMVSKTWE